MRLYGRVDCIGSNDPCRYAHRQMEGPNPPAVGASVDAFRRWIGRYPTHRGNLPTGPKRHET